MKRFFLVVALAVALVIPAHGQNGYLADSDTIFVGAGDSGLVDLYLNPVRGGTWERMVGGFRLEYVSSITMDSTAVFVLPVEFSSADTAQLVPQYLGVTVDTARTGYEHAQILAIPSNDFEPADSALYTMEFFQSTADLLETAYLPPPVYRTSEHHDGVCLRVVVYADSADTAIAHTWIRYLGGN
jgi:hypothetical protein